MSADFPKGLLRKGPMEEMPMQEEEGELQIGRSQGKVIRWNESAGLGTKVGVCPSLWSRRRWRTVWGSHPQTAPFFHGETDSVLRTLRWVLEEPDPLWDHFPRGGPERRGLGPAVALCLVAPAPTCTLGSIPQRK